MNTPHGRHFWVLFLGNQSPFAEEFQFVYEHLLATKNIMDANDKFFHFTLCILPVLSADPCPAQGAAGRLVTFWACSSRSKMATAFFSFWAALIKIYSYFRLYTFMSIYVKNSCWPCLCLVSHHLQNHIWPSKRLNLISNLLHTHNKELNRTRMGNTQMLN